MRGGEKAWVYNPRWSDLARLASAGYGYTIRSAEGDDTTNSKVYDWLRARIRGSVTSGGGSVVSLVRTDGTQAPPDGTDFGYYYKLESGDEAWLYLKRASLRPEMSYFFADSAASDSFLIASPETSDSVLLEKLGIVLDA